MTIIFIDCIKKFLIFIGLLKNGQIVVDQKLKFHPIWIVNPLVKYYIILKDIIQTTLHPDMATFSDATRMCLHSG